MSSEPPPQSLAEFLKSAGGGDGGGDNGSDDRGAAAAEVAAWLVERVSNLSDASSSSQSSSASLASLLDDLASSLRSGGSDAALLDAGVFDWAPRVLGAADGEADRKEGAAAADGDRDRAPSTSSSSSPVAAAVQSLASALATHLSPREALALFSVEMASSTGGQGSLSPKQAALLSALPLALSRLRGTRARIPSTTGALSAATSALIRALTTSASPASAAEGCRGSTGSSRKSNNSSSNSTLSFIAACQGAIEFASALPAVAVAWRTGGATAAEGEEEKEQAKARSLLASSLLRLLPASCLPFAPLLPASDSAMALLRPQTVFALRRGEERALLQLGSSSSGEKRERAAEAAGRVAVAVVSALCSLSSFASLSGSEEGPATLPRKPSFENSWGFSVETSAPPKKQNRKESDAGDEDSDGEEEEEEEEEAEEEQEAAAVGRTPSALSLSLATYASAWCSFEGRSGEEPLRASSSASASASFVAAATASSRSLAAAATSVPALLEAAFARRSPGLVVAAAQLASVAAAAAAAAAAVESATTTTEAALPQPSPASALNSSSAAARRLLPHLARAMSFTPSSAARNACYEAWEATLRAMPASERAAECARVADEAAAVPSPSSPGGPRPSTPSLPASPPPPNAALEALALHHLTSLVASSWLLPRSSSSSAAAEEEKTGAATAAAAAALAGAATERVFPLSPRSGLGWGGSEVSLLDRVEPVAASLAALRLLLLRGKAAAAAAPSLSPSAVSKLPAPLLALVSADEEQRRWRRRALVGEALLPLRAAACSAAQGLRAAAGESGKECAGGGSEAGLAVERLLDALARVLELAEA